jgi:uncharacterized membrane protein
MASFFLRKMTNDKVLEDLMGAGTVIRSSFDQAKEDPLKTAHVPVPPTLRKRLS